MALEQYANDAVSSLVGAIDDSVTTATLADASAFPASGDFRVKLSRAELALCTGVAGNVLTLVRGVEGIPATDHADGAEVSMVLSAEGIKNVAGLMHLSGTLAARPAAGVAGRIYFPDDGLAIYRDNGTDWEGWGPIRKMTPPDESQFSWVNQSTSTLDTTRGYSALQTAPGTGGRNIRLRVTTAPVPPYVLTAAVLMRKLADDETGVLFRNSGSGHFTQFKWYRETTSRSPALWITTNTSPQTATANAKSQLVTPPLGPLWMRLEDDGVNRKYSFSADGYHFVEVLSEPRTTFMTPDQIGYGASTTAAGDTSTISVLSWEVA